ncbi:MAG: tRNA (N(6)-L-threonylcarbamoyladenosine(37)-C(2))-methylthiotransferase MtaB [Candidatus Kapabacteria bacterium]|nr:tRNA (N(6)-L-threonylcarbamoyladenosine(37)-C(2))-methylthiotransferase MtaB [Candidatus Kapabacteria bacterium]
MKISYYNIGCKVNFSEIATIQQKLEKKGHTSVEFGEKSDAVIINTCSVTNNADSDARKIIRRALRTNPEALICVLGCYAQLKPGEIAQIDGVDAIFGTKEKFNVVNYIESKSKRSKPDIFVSDLEDLPFHTACSEDNESHTRLTLKIQDGCDYVCTYCTIPKARGNSRSMPFEELKTKLLELNDTDYYEIVLSGVNLGEYLSPTGENFLDLVKFIDQANLKQRFRISSIEPNLLKPEIIDIISKSETFCHHFHIPLQSGSPEILKLMKRRYKAEYFENLIYSIKEKIPDCCIGVDVISGFPGETDEHFNETYKLLEKLPVSYLHSFTYSERANTPAADFKGIVPVDVRKSRTIALRDLSDKKRKQFYASQLNKIKTLLPEEFDKNQKVLSGWTENYVKTKLIIEIDKNKEEVIPNYSESSNSFRGTPIKVLLKEIQGEFVIAERKS